MTPAPRFPALPVDLVLPGIREALAAGSRLILEAEPGAGKTTRVPLALYQEPWVAGRRIVMLEPRRLAAKAAARHMARLLGEAVGRTVGYRTALEARDSPDTRILVVTEGILTRMLQADSELKGIACLIFDEFHERSLHADLGLALSLDCQDALRPDLRIVIMSATLDGEALSALLDNCPRITAPGRNFPVTVRHVPPARPGLSCEEQVVPVVSRALRDETGSMLVFLPGSAEIKRTVERLAPHLPSGVVLRPLYGDLPPEAQDAAVAPAVPGERKIVLATNIAETSLTIEGVRVVIDSGLTRRQSMGAGAAAWGMSRLVTERISRAAAEQRCGRAGRTESGICLRLWPEHEHAALRPAIRPEVLDSDLAGLCLELAVWGVSDPAHLRWLDTPPREAWERARALLFSLEALDAPGAAGKVTPRGRAMAALPLHPRLAHMVLEGKVRGQGLTACALAALAQERDPLRGGAARNSADIGLRLALLLDEASSSTDGLIRKLRDQMRRIAIRIGLSPHARADREYPNAGALVALAWPERVALRRGPGSYLMANGRGAALPSGDPLVSRSCLAIAELDAGEGDARIHLAAPLELEELESLFGNRIAMRTEVIWDADRQAVSAKSRRCLGALMLSEVPVSAPASMVKKALLTALLQSGLAVLPWTPELTSWLHRVRFVHGLIHRGVLTLPAADPDWPDLTDTILLDTLPDWLGPHLDGINRLAQIRPELLAEALHPLLPWPLPRKLDELAPERLTVPSGSRILLDYSTIHAGANPPGAPVLAVKLQELFGLTATPTVASGRVPVALHLLSPAGRPVQITGDLAGFWRQSYAAVRAELRGRYPRHPWPDDPLTAVPTRHTKRRA